VVYDIPSRALLFRAAGDSTVKGRSGPYTATRERREDALEGFELATDRLIADLQTTLAEFDRQARTGTVRGPGTPSITMVDRTGVAINGAAGAGALDPVEMGAVLALVLALATLPRGRGPDSR
jgi:rhombotail lipoprotein